MYITQFLKLLQKFTKFKQPNSYRYNIYSGFAFYANIIHVSAVFLSTLHYIIVYCLIIYKEMFLGCDWLIRVQLIPNITQNSAKICNTVQKSVTTVQKSVTTVQKSVTTVQKSVISSLIDGIYSLKNQKYGD